MDIRIVVARSAIFLIVYFLVLGIPFLVGTKLLGIGLWLIPAGVCTILASLGPLVYLFLKERAENKLLQEERRIQDLLKAASLGLTTKKIKDSGRLPQLIVYLVTRTVRLRHSAVYIEDSCRSHSRVDFPLPPGEGLGTVMKLLAYLSSGAIV